GRRGRSGADGDREDHGGGRIGTRSVRTSKKMQVHGTMRLAVSANIPPNWSRGQVGSGVWSRRPIPVTFHTITRRRYGLFGMLKGGFIAHQRHAPAAFAADTASMWGNRSGVGRWENGQEEDLSMDHRLVF